MVTRLHRRLVAGARYPAGGKRDRDGSPDPVHVIDWWSVTLWAIAILVLGVLVVLL